MIGIGRHTDYAARIVLHLASQKAGARVTAQDIAGERLIPSAFVRRIVSRLSAAGILKTVRGVGGGVTLARPPSQINLWHLVEAMEGRVALNVCVEMPTSCPLAQQCPVQDSWTLATDKLRGFLSGVDFARLTARLPEKGNPRALKGPAGVKRSRAKAVKKS